MVTKGKGGETSPPIHASGNTTAASSLAPASSSPTPKRANMKKLASVGGYVLAILIAVLAFLGLLFPKERSQGL